MDDKPENIPLWFKGEDNTVSLYSSVRISRNFKGLSFPSSPGYGSFREIEKKTDNMLSQHIRTGRITKISLSSVSQEQLIIYKKLRLLPEKRNAVLNKFALYNDILTGAWLLTNYNDHLTFFNHSQGTKIRKAYDDCTNFIELFDESIFSRDDTGNFHTSEIGYFGSGLKCFSVLTLPALAVTEEVRSITSQIQYNGYSVRNFFGRYPECFLIISNRDSYSKSAGKILSDFIRILNEIKKKMREIEDGKDGMLEEITGKCNKIINFESLTFDDFIKIYNILSFLRIKGKTNIRISRINEFLLKVILDSPGVDPGTVLRRSLKDDLADIIKNM